MPFAVDGYQVTPIPLDAENAHAFLFEGDGQRVLVAMDETHGWTVPDLGPLDVAVLPVGVFEHHPYTGERLIPGGVLQAAREEDALRTGARDGAGARGSTDGALPRRGDGPHVARRARRLGESDGWEPAFDGMMIE